MVLSLSLKQLVQVADNRTSLKDHNYEHILEHFSHIKVRVEFLTCLM